MNDELQIIPSFKDSLFDYNAKGILKDIAEISIDSIIQDGLLKDIPIVSTLVAIGKVGTNIHERNLLKQTLVFIKTFNNHTINQDKLNIYKDSINNDPKKAEAELGRVVILLNNNIDDIKSNMLAKCFVAYVNEYISWRKFCKLSDSIARLFTTDLDLIFRIYNNEVNNTKQCELHQAERLNSIGLINMSLLEVYTTVTHKHLSISKLGKELCNFTMDI